MKTYLKHGLGLIGASVVMGSIPNISGTATETNLKANFSAGLGHIGSTLPLQGKVLGTKMALHSVKKLKGAAKMKGGFKL